MIERFQGEGGKPTLLLALKNQFCVRDNKELALALIEKVKLNEYKSGQEIITQDSDNNEVHFILAGQVDVKVNNRHITYREAGIHIGEMATIDQRIKRSASVSAIETTVTASLTCDTFHEIADRYPQLWRYFSLELSNRLRQRNNFIKTPNPIPELFLGSSKDSIRVVEEFMNKLNNTLVVSRPWYSGDIFHPSDTALEDLEILLSKVDFAAFVFSPDDILLSRDEYYQGARDNIIMEFGLFVGALGRKRTFILQPKNMDIKTPSDQLGIEQIYYWINEQTGEIDISNAIKNLMNRIHSLGVK